MNVLGRRVPPASQLKQERSTKRRKVESRRRVRKLPSFITKEEAEEARTKLNESERRCGKLCGNGQPCKTLRHITKNGSGKYVVCQYCSKSEERHAMQGMTKPLLIERISSWQGSSHTRDELKRMKKSDLKNILREMRQIAPSFAKPKTPLRAHVSAFGPWTPPETNPEGPYPAYPATNPPRPRVQPPSNRRPPGPVMLPNRAVLEPRTMLPPIKQEPMEEKLPPGAAPAPQVKHEYNVPLAQMGLPQRRVVLLKQEGRMELAEVQELPLDPAVLGLYPLRNDGRGPELMLPPAYNAYSTHQPQRYTHARINPGVQYVLMARDEHGMYRHNPPAFGLPVYRHPAEPPTVHTRAAPSGLASRVPRYQSTRVQEMYLPSGATLPIEATHQAGYQPPRMAPRPSQHHRQQSDPGPARVSDSGMRLSNAYRIRHSSISAPPEGVTRAAPTARSSHARQSATDDQARFNGLVEAANALAAGVNAPAASASPRSLGLVSSIQFANRAPTPPLMGTPCPSLFPFPTGVSPKGRRRISEISIGTPGGSQSFEPSLEPSRIPPIPESFTGPNFDTFQTHSSSSNSLDGLFDLQSLPPPDHTMLSEDPFDVLQDFSSDAVERTEDEIKLDMAVDRHNKERQNEIREAVALCQQIKMRKEAGEEIDCNQLAGEFASKCRLVKLLLTEINEENPNAEKRVSPCGGHFVKKAFEAGFGDQAEEMWEKAPRL